MLMTHQLENIKKYNQQNQLDTKLDASRYRKLLLIRGITEAIMITLFTYVGLFLGPQDALNTPVWPHTGVLLGIIFLRGTRVAPWILIGSAFAFWQSGHQWAHIISMALLTTVGPILCYGLAHKCIGAVIPLSRVKQLIKALFLFLILGLLLGLCYFELTNVFEGNVYPNSMRWSAMLSYSLGLILFTPICLIWDTYIPGMEYIKSKNTLYFVLSLIFITHTAFGVLSQPIWVACFYGLSLILMTPVTLLYGQFGCTFLGVGTGIYLLSFKDLPGFELVNSYPSAMIWMQVILMLNLMIHLCFATRSKEKHFKWFVSKNLSPKKPV